MSEPAAVAEIAEELKEEESKVDKEKATTPPPVESSVGEEQPKDNEKNFKTSDENEIKDQDIKTEGEDAEVKSENGQVENMDRDNEESPATEAAPESPSVEDNANEEEDKTKEDGDETKENESKPLPTSEGFTEGEAPEPPIQAAEQLSREPTPTPVTEEVDTTELRPDSPVNQVISHIEQEEIVEEEVEVIPQFNRDELLEKYYAAIAEREQLNQKNRVLQHKLAEYFRRKKTEENRQEVDRNVTDQEQRYLKYMSNLDELRQQETVDRKTFNELIEESKIKRAEKQVLVEEECKKAADFKRSVALMSINSRTGRPMTMKELEIYEQAEEKKEIEVSQVRLENIKLRNRLRKRELQLKQKEELAEGLHLIDFEQLKIENQTYNEKIEERNEELMKLRKKITNTVQVLTHLKEKLQFVQGENHSARQNLSHVEEEVAKKRDVLSRTKQARDALRHDNSKLQQNCGLLGNPLLLRDYEEGKDESDDLRHKLDIMKRTHAELTLSLSGVKKKIEQARNNQS